MAAVQKAMCLLVPNISVVKWANLSRYLVYFMLWCMNTLTNQFGLAALYVSAIYVIIHCPVAPLAWVPGKQTDWQLGQSWLKSWTPLHLDRGLKQIFPNFLAVDLAKYGVTIICRYSKDMNFHKIWRVWLKYWACYAHLNFEIQDGVVDSIFQPHPPNFGQW